MFDDTDASDDSGVLYGRYVSDETSVLILSIFLGLKQIMSIVKVSLLRDLLLPRKLCLRASSRYPASLSCRPPCTPIRKAPSAYVDPQAAYPSPESMGRPARPDPSTLASPQASPVIGLGVSRQASLVIPQGVPDDEMDVDRGPKLPSFKTLWEESQQREAEVSHLIEHSTQG